MRRNPMRMVYQDALLLVVDKPAGVDSTEVPPELRVVHRLDRLTSGLIVYARTQGAARRLARQLAAHTVERKYACVAHGQVRSGVLTSRLVRDRGDGLRGSGDAGAGKLAVTHVEALEQLTDRTLCHVVLETGRTHQIRIHMAEAGSPLVGETVYVRDHRAAGHTPLPSSRLMLHAMVLGFVHPASKVLLRFVSPPPW